MTLPRLVATLVAGIGLGVLVTASPLLPAAVLLALAILAAIRRGLPADERRAVTAVLIAAMLARVLVVAGLAAWSLPTLSAQDGGVLLGDEAYLFERSLRARDVALGVAPSKHDYIMVYDDYADTKYTAWLSFVQTLAGPSPYMIRVINGLLFVAAGGVMFRLVRVGFGPTAALWGLAALLFLPSLLFWSVSLLKDAAFFLFTATAFAAAVGAWRSLTPGARALRGVVFVASLWALADLRPGALAITAGGLAGGLVLHLALASRAMLAFAAAAALAAVIVVATVSPVSAAVSEGITWLSRQHMGHVMTPGRAYRTLDPHFYAAPERTQGGVAFTPAEAARYVARAGYAFVTVPLPWRASSRNELAIVPEQLVWYALVVLAIVGLGAAYRRDALLTCLLTGYILAMSAALALANGNVGTLVRVRTLVARFAVWIAAVGLVVLIARLNSRRENT